MRGHHHAVALRLKSFEFFQKLQAVRVSQIDVQQGKIDRAFAEQWFCFLNALCHLASVALGCQDRIQPAANRLVVVNNEDSQLMSYTALRVPRSARESGIRNPNESRFFRCSSSL